MHFPDPIALFHSALDAINAERWLVAAEHCDSVSLRMFKRQMIDQFAPPRPQHTDMAEVLMRHEPDMPREVAEYQAAEFRKRADPGQRLAHELPGISSVEEVSTSEPVALFASWLEGRSPRLQILRLIERGHAPAAAAPRPGFVALERYYRYTALGTVLDGENAAHVVYRSESDETTPWPGEVGAQLATLPLDEQQLSRVIWARSRARLAFCRRQPDGSWCLIADRQFMGMSSSIIASIGSGP